LAFSQTTWAAEATKEEVINIEVTEDGFQPKSINVKPNVPVTLKIIRKTDSTCSTQITIPSMKIKKELPLNQPVIVAIGKLEKGEIRFGCGMNMMDGGRITVK
jgi:plastocyanin domain-containing protein